jgi:hypothetical protein
MEAKMLNLDELNLEMNTLSLEEVEQVNGGGTFAFGIGYILGWLAKNTPEDGALFMGA